MGIPLSPEDKGGQNVIDFSCLTDTELEPLEVPLTGLVTEVCVCDLNTDNVCDNLDFQIFHVDWRRADCPVQEIY